jgi:Family of unknown function (DUF6152)
MNVQRWLAAGAIVLAIGLLESAVPVDAHHASTAFYDATKKVEAQGPVTKFLFKNPHAVLYFNATDEKGETVEWQIELGAPLNLARTGWTPDTLKPGMVIKVAGQPSKAEGSHGICCATITKPDGSPIVAGGRVREEAAPK